MCAPVGIYTPLFNYFCRGSKSNPEMSPHPPPQTVKISSLLHLQNLLFYFQQFHSIVAQFKSISRIDYVMGMHSNSLPSFSHAETALLDFWHVTVNSSRKLNVYRTHVVLVKI
jgi:hypothetical protein